MIFYKDFLEGLKECPFCNGYNKFLSENDEAFLTYATAPYRDHHLLVIPKRHTESFLELNEKENIGISSLLREAVELLYECGYGYCSILVREGMDAGKSVGHLHYHIIPNIRLGDIDQRGLERTVLSQEEIDRVIRDIDEAKKKAAEKKKS
ncbi:MAG: HIT domain-containing protein [Parcubacteria group bacterium]|nr:HIT domain-containing protein [Parcubacteria group bacterium]